MKLYKQGSRAIVEHAGGFHSAEVDWDAFVNRANLFECVLQDLQGFERCDPVDAGLPLDPPMLGQELWAAGVTYFRSREARMAESQDAGGGDFYDKVYHAERPELFFKGLLHRVSGHLGEIRIRHDSVWDVPEPELTLFISSAGSIEGYTIGNDVSSRSIEGENPLYLPQAKTYDRSAALGPSIWVRPLPMGPDTGIALEISRGGVVAFSHRIRLAQMKRTPEELAGWLFREASFPKGCFLMTGTGIVPPDDFTLQPGDTVRITIDGIGTLINHTNRK